MFVFLICQDWRTGLDDDSMGQRKNRPIPQYVAQRVGWGSNMFPVSKFGKLRRFTRELIIPKNKSEALEQPSTALCFPPSCDRVVVGDTGSGSRFHKRQCWAKYIKLRKVPSNFKPLNFVGSLDVPIRVLSWCPNSVSSQVPVRFFWHSLPGIWDCIRGKPGVLRRTNS